MSVHLCVCLCMCTSVLESLCVSQLTNVNGSKVSASVYMCQYFCLCLRVNILVCVWMSVSVLMCGCACMRAHAHPPMCCSTFVNGDSDKL